VYAVSSSFPKEPAIMLGAERREIIRKLIQEQGAVQVVELSQRFDVSRSTIRRDLDWLSENAKVRRTYGGAVAADSPTPPILKDSGETAKRIAKAAVELIAAEETVFVGPGPLCQATAQELCRRSGLTVITNALEIAWTVYQGSSLPLIITGGPVLRPPGAMVGQLALRALETLRADRLIIEVSGASPIEGLTSDQLPQAEIIRPLLESVSHVVALTTAERLGRAGAAWLGAIGEADVIITGRNASAAIAWDLSEMGIKVMLV
jgi:DeoR/GlpR family transcriptional regulator of sugar metabolism